MHKLTICNMGPVRYCTLDISQFMTLTGFQASGKSTIAKAIYYFRTIKNDILDLSIKRMSNQSVLNRIQEKMPSLEKELGNYLREKFIRTFGSSWHMPMDMRLEYRFSESCFIEISLKKPQDYPLPNYIWIQFSDTIREFLKRESFHAQVFRTASYDQKWKYDLQEELDGLFEDRYEVVYIPAGRSMMTLLSEQLNYIYATMDDAQKRSLDICTKDYLERILRLKPEFSEGIAGIFARHSAKDLPLNEILNRMSQILRGQYQYHNGEERIVLDDNKYVKLNFSSSGQQECVWILNLLCYYLAQAKPVLFIIEEPESHLFPESQKYMMELVALAGNYGHAVIVTTHSPYVLGTLNNLLYAGNIPENNRMFAQKVIPSCCWLFYRTFSAYFVKDGKAEDCMDHEIHMIQNERIDEISKVINEEFERLLELY